MDQLQDTLFSELWAFSQKYKLPEYVKSADASALHSSEAYREVPSTLFADSRHRRLPVDSKAACWLSWAHFLEKRAAWPPEIAEVVEQRLWRAAQLYGIEQDIQEMHAAKKAAAASEGPGSELETLPDEAFAIVRYREGRKERLYPLRNAKEVKAAAQWLRDYRDDLDYGTRRALGGKILEKAAAFGIRFHGELGTWLNRQAGYGFGVSAEVADEIEKRLKAADPRKVDPAVKAGLSKLAAVLRSDARLMTDPNAQETVCEVLDQFDQEAGFAGHYDELIRRPEEVVYSVPTKEAMELVDTSVELPTGSVFSAEQLARLPVEEIRGTFGEAFAERVLDGLDVDGAKLAEEAKSMDYQDAELLESILTRYGEKPLLRAVTETRIPDEARNGLAELYRIQHLASQPL